ncbi:dTMP kinase [Acidocella sp.]|uniref:dTMP kinase n=1 Tax=Acidocella sp. TaxID=50710 RepID=UPI0026030777|nr:dTMP kinase [Acidocella sp.]MDD2795872.1 dTMP kinase [Acidocella sp.]
MSTRHGVFVTLEGGEGVGKSTAALRLTALLREAGHEVVATREPGGTPGAEAIRDLLLNADTELTALAQTMLHFAARADHVARVIRPALARGAVVISDRYSDSTMAYQAYGMGVEIAAVDALIRLTGLTPDITFILEVPESVSKSRIKSRGAASDRYERMDAEVMARIAQGFRAIAAAAPARCVMLDGTEPVEVVVARMRGIIQERTGR